MMHSMQDTPMTNGTLTRGMPFRQYMKLPGEHSSTLKRMMLSPLHYRHARDTVRADSDDFRIGRATHTAVLEPDRFPLEYVVYSESKTKGEGAKKNWDAFKAANANKTILDESDYMQALAIRDAVRANPLARDLLAKGSAEVTAQWSHRGTGLACKARYDWLGPAGIVDLKTTRGIDPSSFSRDVAKFAYHVQFALYAEGHAQITGERLPFWAIVVEKSAPHDVIVYRVPEPLIEEAWKVAWSLLDRVRECTDSGVWPGIADGALELALPEWANGTTKTQGLELEMPDGELLSF